MIMKMRNMMKRQNGQKGFTLVELIVVMAILAILAAIAVPKYTGIQDTAKVKADGSTAMAIIHAARLQEGTTGTAVTGVPGQTTPGTNPLKTTYLVVPGTAQSGGTFALSKAGDVYSVKWTPTIDTYAVEQTVSEDAMGTWKPLEKTT